MLNYLKTVSPFSGPSSIMSFAMRIGTDENEAGSLKVLRCVFLICELADQAGVPTYLMQRLLRDSNGEREETHEEASDESPGSLQNVDEFSAIPFQVDPEEETAGEPLLP